MYNDRIMLTCACGHQEEVLVQEETEAEFFLEVDILTDIYAHEDCERCQGWE